MTQSAKWIATSEAQRLTGLSTRTIKRMIAEGRLRSAKTRGGHVRVLRADVDKLLRPDSPATDAATDPLKNKRERVSELVLDAQTLRARRELKRLRAEDSQEELARREEAHAALLAEQRTLEEMRLNRERLAQDRDRVRKREDHERWERTLVNRAIKVFPDWFSLEQEKAVIAAVKQTLANYDVGDDSEEIGEAVNRTINRVAGPWQAEREREESERRAAQRRESLIERAAWPLPFQATDAEKLSAKRAARDALADLPLSASQSEEQTAVKNAIDKTKQAVEGRLREERAQADAARAQESAKWQEIGRQAVEKQRRESATKNLILYGELRLASYIRELYDEGDIDRRALSDTAWQDQLKAELREQIEKEFSGTESTEAAEDLACRIVNEALG